VLNLATNGCDAMAEVLVEDRELLVTTEVLEDQRILVCVADRGPGIPPELIERVFEPFFSTKAHGLGLGLTVCRQIVSAHDGRLWATNNAARGARFCLTLPVQ
jgi:C4-dicarboxylate-specific signal transduction histidine kinase